MNTGPFQVKDTLNLLIFHVIRVFLIGKYLDSRVYIIFTNKPLKQLIN